MLIGNCIYMTRIVLNWKNMNGKYMTKGRRTKMLLSTSIPCSRRVSEKPCTQKDIVRQSIIMQTLLTKYTIRTCDLYKNTVKSV